MMNTRILRSTLCRALIAAAALTIAGCASDNSTPATGSKLLGIVLAVPQDGTRTTVFLAHRDTAPELSQLLKDVLAGVPLAEPWHRLEVPNTALPAPDKETSFDLSVDSSITITERSPYPNTPTPGDPNWQTYSLESGMAGLTGTLTITGASVVKQKKPNAMTPSGEHFGVAYGLTFKGALEIGGTMRDNVGMDIGVGAFAVPMP